VRYHQPWNQLAFGVHIGGSRSLGVLDDDEMDALDDALRLYHGLL
jgi:hypothetical protein